MAVSPDARKVISGSVDKTVRIWDVETGQIEKVLEGHSDAIRPVAFSRDGERIAAGYWDDTLRIWTVRTGEVEVPRLAALEHLKFKSTSPDTSEIIQSSDSCLSSRQVPASGFQHPCKSSNLVLELSLSVMAMETSLLYDIAEYNRAGYHHVTPERSPSTRNWQTP